MIYLQNNRGVAAVELAICLPILTLLVFGSIEFGLLFYNQQVITNASREGVYNQQVITNASREGVRAGIVAETKTEDIKLIVENYCSGKLINLNGSSELDSDLIITNPDEDPEDGFPDPDLNNDIFVRVSYKYNFLLASILGFTDKTLSAQTVMRME